MATPTTINGAILINTCGTHAGVGDLESYYSAPRLVELRTGRETSDDFKLIVNFKSLDII